MTDIVPVNSSRWSRCMRVHASFAHATMHMNLVSALHILGCAAFLPGCCKLRCIIPARRPQTANCLEFIDIVGMGRLCISSYGTCMGTQTFNCRKFHTASHSLRFVVRNALFPDIEVAGSRTSACTLHFKRQHVCQSPVHAIMMP